MQALYNELPENLAASADWTLLTKTGKKFPCHGLCLRIASPVLAAAADCPGPVCVHFPDNIDEDLAVLFLRWVYHLPIGLTADAAYELALLGHQWNIKGDARRNLAQQLFGPG